MTSPSEPGYLEEILSTAVTPNTFLTWLTKGLGRAVLYLRRHDPVQYREAIAFACTKNLKYEYQCESNRAFYLKKVIDATNDIDYYAKVILDAYQSGSGEEYDRGQISLLAS